MVSIGLCIPWPWTLEVYLSFFFSLAVSSLIFSFSSDGAQIGNVASALGVVGVWTTPDRDEGSFNATALADSELTSFEI